MYCDCKNPDIKILMYLHVSSPSEYEIVVFSIPHFCTYVLCMCVCTYEYMYTSVGASPAPAWLDRIYSYLILKCVSVIG